MPGVTAIPLTFGFEADYAAALQFIPLSVRLKFDECGLKVSLPQWSRLTLTERQLLLQRPCETPEERRTYGMLLESLIESGSGERIGRIAVPEHPQWRDGSRVPTQVEAYFMAQGLTPPSGDQWRRLAPLQRYVLIKFTRPGRRNDNLTAALREFGLLPR
jgi:hypothetical protein